MAQPQTRRMFNQAFVKKAYIKGKRISKHEFTDSYTDVIFSPSSHKNYLAVLSGWYSNFELLEESVECVGELGV